MRPGMVFVAVRVAVAAVGLFALGLRAEAGGLPDDRLGVRIAPLLLLSRPDVRADLRIDPARATEADRFVADLHDKAQALRGRGDAQAVAARRAIDDESRAWLDAHLTPAQRSRLAQVDLQWEGPSALVSRPIVADSLALTDDQRNALSRAIASRNARRNGGPPVLADEAKLAETALGLLDKHQRDTWHAMLGAPLPFVVASRPGATPPARR